MRKFYLENSIGERKDLQTRGGLFLHLPAGLGWSDNNTYASAQGFFPRLSSEPEQPAPSGELIIGGYDEYMELVSWIFGGYDLTLVYNPNGIEYRIDVDITSVSKGELKNRLLVCSITMAAKTPWYKPTVKELSISPPASEAGYKRYPYSYPYQYASSSLQNSVEILAGGHMPAAIYVSCPGPLTNPAVKLYDASGASIGVLDLDGVNVASGETLIFSTRFGNIGVWRDDTDLVEYLDLTNDNFFEIPINTACTLTLESDSDIGTTSTLKLYEYYRSV